MTATPPIVIWNWVERHKKELLEVHSAEEVKNHYIKTVIGNSTRTRHDEFLLNGTPWDVIYKSLCAERGATALTVS